MLLELMVTALVWQASPSASPAVVATQSPPDAQAAAPVATISGRRVQADERVTCENRPRTGSVLRRSICRTERRRNADARAAKDYVGEVTSGSENQPFFPGGVTPP